jgi:hypothetical protein
MTYDLTANCSRILRGPSHAPARSFLNGIGFTTTTCASPSSASPSRNYPASWTGKMPGNFNLRKLVASVQDGLRSAADTATAADAELVR